MFNYFLLNSKLIANVPQNPGLGKKQSPNKLTRLAGETRDNGKELRKISLGTRYTRIAGGSHSK
jgi:hypothetical protein